MLCLGEQRVVFLCPLDTVDAASFPAVSGNGPQAFSLLGCFSLPAPVPPKEHKAEDIYLIWFSLMNSPSIQKSASYLQALSAQDTIQGSNPATSSLPGALLLSVLPLFF